MNLSTHHNWRISYPVPEEALKEMIPLGECGAVYHATRLCEEDAATIDNDTVCDLKAQMLCLCERVLYKLLDTRADLTDDHMVYFDPGTRQFYAVLPVSHA